MDKKKILVVDDSSSMRQMLSYTLKLGGYDTIDAVDGEDAFTKLEGDNFDMIITDLNMPKLDGIEFIKKTRGSAKGKFIPIVMLTTESQQERKMQGKAAGATGWIVKPFKPEQLISVVKKVLGC
ncbi:MAG: response regulator [Candidatus Riflebacteria bacterium]|nr:response regulator [Candidatus Riflebacteria bacterium]